jgi:hypothetical protein
MEPDQIEQLNNVETVSPVGAIIGLLFIVLMFAAMWKVFTKADEPGWAAIIPIYNMIVLVKIAGKPLWWVLLLFIPIVGLVFAIVVSLGVAEKFGKGAGYGIGLALLPFIFYPMLGFGSAPYIGPKTA